MEIKLCDHIVDLMQVLNSAVPAWEKSCGFKFYITFDYDQVLDSIRAATVRER